MSADGMRRAIARRVVMSYRSVVLQVALGGFHGATQEDRDRLRRQGEGERRKPVIMGSAVFVIAAVAMLGVVSFTAVEDGADVLLSDGDKAVHSLHFVNSLHPETAAKVVENDTDESESSLKASVNSILGSTDGVLASAKLAAQNRLDGKKMPKAQRTENAEELTLKERLDASVKAKEKDTLAQELHSSSKNMKDILAEAAAADRAKHLKVKVTNVDSYNSGDSAEEAALRKQLDEDATKRQAALLRKADPAMSDVRGRHERMSVAANRLARKAGKQLSESALEAELRQQLNSKVKHAETSMFKSSVNHWLGKHAAKPAAAAPRARTGTPLQHGLARAPSDSLKMAEKLMKTELGYSKHSVGKDTTLSHASLAPNKLGKTKQAGLGELEAAMMQSTMSKARKDEPKLRAKHEMMRKLRMAAKEKLKQAKLSKPSFQSAMQKFTARSSHLTYADICSRMLAYADVC